MSSPHYLDTPHGQIHWLYDEPRSVTGQRAARPTLLFIHAGVSDHTLWDGQVAFFTERGWGVLRYDIFGYGSSNPSTEYLNSEPRRKVRHYEHAASVAKALTANNGTSSQNLEAREGQFVAIGLSRGAGIAIELAAAYPNLVCGLVVVAGALTGIDPPNQPEEDAQLGEWFKSMKAGDVEKAAAIFTHYWGDGPLAAGDRMGKDSWTKLYAWCHDITQREVDRSGGGFSIPFEGPSPPPAEHLSSISIPVATATGKHDETGLMEGMRILTDKLNAGSVKEFETAHMINLEDPEGFNPWLEDFLNRFIT